MDKLLTVIPYLGASRDNKTPQVYSLKKISEVITKGLENGQGSTLKTIKEEIAQLEEEFRELEKVGYNIRMEWIKLEIQKRKQEQIPAVCLVEDVHLREKCTFLGFAQIDIDGKDNPMLDIILEHHLEEIYNHRSVVLAFRSIRNGLKLIIRVPDNSEGYYKAYDQIVYKLETKYQLKCDLACRKPHQLMLMSYDPNCYYNESPEEYVIDSKLVIPSKNTSNSKRSTERKNYDVGQTIVRATDIIEQIESDKADITSNRECWLKLTIALSTLGEAGRDLIHRISQFYQDYSKEEVDKLFNDFVGKTVEDGISMGTFFGICKEFGYTPNIKFKNSKTDSEDEVEEHIDTPTFGKEIHDKQPEVFKKILSTFKGERKKDVALLSILVCCSSIAGKFKYRYHGARTGANLFCTIVARAGTGKSSMMRVATLFDKPIREFLLDEYKKELKQFHQNKAILEEKDDKKGLSELKKPVLKTFKISGDISKSALVSNIVDNDSVGLIFESELDTITSGNKKDYGDFGDLLRKIFENEPVGYSRNTIENKHTDDPRNAFLTTGTTNQFFRFIPSPEDGMFSRLMMYVFFNRVEFENPFDYNESEVYMIEDEFSDWALNLYHYVNTSLYPRKLEISQGAQELIIEFGEKQLAANRKLFGEESNAVSLRATLMALRIAIIYSLIEGYENNVSTETLVIARSQVQLAIQIMGVTIKHSYFMYAQYSKSAKESNLNSKDLGMKRLYDALPAEFQRMDAIKLGKELLKCNKKTIDNYLRHLTEVELLEKQPATNGKYRKTN